MNSCPRCGVKFPPKAQQPIRCLCVRLVPPLPAPRHKTPIEPAVNPWDELHAYPCKVEEWDRVEAEAWYGRWRKKVPSINCDCQTNWSIYEEANPPDFRSRRAFFVWGFHAHDHVSEEHSGAARITLAEAERIHGYF